jgi:Pyridoxamine 5'-phosphate oxidase
MREQRRGRSLAMTDDEQRAMLTTQRTCRIATVRHGVPHLSAVWFVWNDGVLWVNSVVRSQRWTDITASPQVSVIIDDGVEFGELRGIEIIGRAEVVGEAPRTGEPVPDLVEPERLFGDKYSGGIFHYDGGHAWFKVVPEKIVSWDLGKMRRG